MRARIFFLAALLFGIFAANAHAQINSGQNNTIRGKVRSNTGAVINNAIVTLSKAGGGTIGEMVTSNDGDFTFIGLVGGEYVITVNASGFETTTQNVAFNQSPYERFHDTLNVEVVIAAKPEQVLAAPPGTSFVQEVPKAARAAYEKGIARLAEGKSDEGIALLQQAIEVFNTYFDACYALGAAYYRAGKYDEAIAALEKARQVNDRDGAVYHMFGMVMLKQGKLTVAEYAFKQAAVLNANSVASHFYHGYALIELANRSKAAKERGDELTEAQREFGTAWDLSNKRLFAVYLETARIHEMIGDKEAAAKDLEAYLKGTPDAKQAASIRQEITKLRGAEPPKQ